MSEMLPLLRLRLKVCITGPSTVCTPPAWLGTTTRPFEVAEYLVLQAVRIAIEIRVRTAAIQANLILILCFFSCERSNAVPGG
jgi:hypothetical protein